MMVHEYVLDQEILDDDKKVVEIIGKGFPFGSATKYAIMRT